MSERNRRVCPVEIAGGLDTRLRRWIQNPQKILGPYIREGMIVLDIGCGPGFFSIDMAQMVGKSGRVIAADLQEGMLQKLRDKIQGTELEERVTMVHEVPNVEGFFSEVETILNPGGQVFMVEPPFHV